MVKCHYSPHTITINLFEQYEISIAKNVTDIYIIEIRRAAAFEVLILAKRKDKDPVNSLNVNDSKTER